MGKGLLRYDGKNWSTLTKTDGLAHNEVYWCLQDRNDQFWFGLWQAGVSRYDGRVFQTLTKDDGLSDNGVRVVLEGRDGEFWFGTHNGVTRYRPPAPSPPRVSIKAIVANRRHEGIDELAISSAVERTTFEFHGMSFKTRPDGLIYRYRLDGYDKDWRLTTDGRVEYEDLPPGDYTLELHAIDRDLVYSKSPATFNLTVHLPYERIGLMAALIVALALIAWQAVRLIQRGTRLADSNGALSDANKKLFNTNLELQDTMDDLRAAETQMVHSEKMAGLGKLVAGVAHELNNPIGFIYANMDHLRRYVTELSEMGANGSPTDAMVDRRTKVFDSLSRLIESSAGGADRIKRIVQGLRTFSRLDESERKTVDIHEGLDTTMVLLEHDLKEGIQVHKEYGDLPHIDCFAGELNQVFMNLLINAIDATGGKGEISIQTALVDDNVRIRIVDNGRGIEPDDLKQIFDPFFTTKDVGEGTGLGLSISYGIVQDHKGQILVDSKVGEGTTLTVMLPVELSVSESIENAAGATS